MSVIMIGFASCGGNNNGHSKAFNESKKILDNVMSEIQKAKTCDDVDMAAFGILGLLGVDGVENMGEAEQEELSKITDEMEKVMTQKKAALDCKEDEGWFTDDDDMPADDLFEESEVME